MEDKNTHVGPRLQSYFEGTLIETDRVYVDAHLKICEACEQDYQDALKKYSSPAENNTIQPLPVSLMVVSPETNAETPDPTPDPQAEHAVPSDPAAPDHSADTTTSNPAPPLSGESQETEPSTTDTSLADTSAADTAQSPSSDSDVPLEGIGTDEPAIPLPGDVLENPQTPPGRRFTRPSKKILAAGGVVLAVLLGMWGVGKITTPRTPNPLPVSPPAAPAIPQLPPLNPSSELPALRPATSTAPTSTSTPPAPVLTPSVPTAVSKAINPASGMDELQDLIDSLPGSKRKRRGRGPSVTTREGKAAPAAPRIMNADPDEARDRTPPDVSSKFFIGASGLPEWKGSSSGIRSFQTVVIRNEREWRALWRQHSGSDTREAPDMDFEQYIVVGVFAGSKPNGSTVEITNTEEELPATLVVYFRETPGASSAGSESSAHPYHMWVIIKTSLDVTFKRRS